MRALVLGADGVRLDEQAPEPSPGPGEVRVRVAAAALGRTTVETSRGLSAHRGVLGSFASGTVDATGAGVPGRWSGTRVAFPVLGWCGACERCRRGLRDHCEERTLLGFAGRDGVLAEAVLVSAGGLVELPASVDEEQGAFAAIVAAALRIVRRAGAAPGPFVTVLGDGPLGLCVLSLLSAAREGVRLVGTSDAGLMRAAQWGLRHRPLGEIGRRGDQDLVVDCTGRPGGLAVALELVRPGGTILRPGLESGREDDADAPATADDEVAALGRGGADGLPALARLALGEVVLAGCGFGEVGPAVDAIARGDVDVGTLVARRGRLAEGLVLLRARAAAGSLEIIVRP